MRFLAVFLLAQTLLVAPAAAEFEESDFLDLPDAVVLEARQTIRPQLKHFKTSETEFIGEETPEELADPLLTDSMVEEAVVRGMISVTAEWCGLEWVEVSFKPFMQEKRLSGRTPKQMAFTGGLHGYGMGLLDKELENETCGDETRQNLEALFRE